MIMFRNRTAKSATTGAMASAGGRHHLAEHGLVLAGKLGDHQRRRSRALSSQDQREERDSFHDSR